MTTNDALQTVLAPIDSATFARDYWHRDMLHVAGTSGRFHALADWAHVNAMLASHRLEPPRCELVKRSERIDVARWTHERGGGRIIDAGAARALLGQGATLVVSFAEEILPAVRRLCDGLAEALCAPCNVNLYAGWRSEQGFNLHWDTHDVFVLQVYGRKRWRVFRPTVDGPVRTRRDDVPQPDGAPFWEGVLEDGAMLYLPRGWWHDATPFDEPSLHLTVAVTPPAARDYLHWLIGRIEHHAIGRRDIPRLATPDALADYFDTLRDIMLAEWDAGPDGFFEQFDAKRFALPIFDLPAVAALPGTIAPQTRVRLASFRRLAISAGASGDSIVVHNGTQRWTCERAIAPALRALRSARDCTFDALCAKLADPVHAGALRKQLTLWAAAGVVFLDFGGPPAN